MGLERSIPFWFSSWKGLPLRSYRDGLQRPARQNISLAESVPMIRELMPDWPNGHVIDLTSGEDLLRWHWEQNGLYTRKLVSTC